MSFSISPNGKARTVKKMFSRETAVAIRMQADPARIWALLTDAAAYPRWNSTVTSIEGNIAAGEQIKLQSILDPKRTFKLKIKAFEQFAADLKQEAERA
jgi:uncharacterized protein YndB with AHSA1/START domain